MELVAGTLILRQTSKVWIINHTVGLTGQGSKFVEFETYSTQPLVWENFSKIIFSEDRQAIKAIAKLMQQGMAWEYITCLFF